MTMIAYKPKRFCDKHLEIIEMANRIIRSHQRQGYTLTLRQIFYQFVKQGLDWFPNTTQSYKMLGGVLNDARYAGLVSWEAMEDRTRSIAKRGHWDDPASMLEVLDRGYHIDMWQNQHYRPEVWVEKDALVGIVAAACHPLDVTYFACRGYVSSSEQWSSAQRILQAIEHGQEPVIFHLGDHDPSGIDMTRDNLDRLEMFCGQSIRLERLGLNWDQVQQYNPPPNPAKETDSRSGPYIKEFGESSWELDALEPSVIVDLIKEAVMDLRDEQAYDECVTKREAERDKLRAVAQVAIAALGESRGFVELVNTDEEES